MGLVKKLFRTLWGVNEPSLEITPPIECDACAAARAAGKDACAEHHTHHAHHVHSHENVGVPEKLRA